MYVINDIELCMCVKGYEYSWKEYALNIELNLH